MDILEFSGRHRFLSNFWPCTVYLAKVGEREIFPVEQYRSVEYAYQAAKFILCHNRNLIAMQPSAGQAKRCAHQLRAHQHPQWHDLKLSVMRDLLVQKFNTPLLREHLMQTHPFQLVEGNTWNDTFWGVCNGKGENHLGRLLMEIRAEIFQRGTSCSIA